MGHGIPRDCASVSAAPDGWQVLIKAKDLLHPSSDSLAAQSSPCAGSPRASKGDSQRGLRGMMERRGVGRTGPQAGRSQLPRTVSGSGMPLGPSGRFVHLFHLLSTGVFCVVVVVVSI